MALEELKFPHCLNEAIMYNADKIVVIGQQAKKKPLVTYLLVKRSYMWGWWCKADYDRFSLTGQVLKLPPVFSYRRKKVTCVSGIHQFLFPFHWRMVSSKWVDNGRFSASALLMILFKPGRGGLIQQKRKPGISCT
jgi:hypothetical protein